jgi:hypothetical protein
LPQHERAKLTEDHVANIKARLAAQRAEAFHIAAEADQLRPVSPPDVEQISDLWLPINDRPAVWPWFVAAAVVVALIVAVGVAAHAAAVAQAATMGAW